MAPGRYTGLFFLDEATALAAGHRPCALCRREDYNRLTEIWRTLHPGRRGADAIDAQLHRERWDASMRTRRLHPAQPQDLPDGASVLLDARPWLVQRGELLAWTPAGYTERIPIRDGGRRRADHPAVTGGCAAGRLEPGGAAPAPFRRSPRRGARLSVGDQTATASAGTATAWQRSR